MTLAFAVLISAIVAAVAGYVAGSRRAGRAAAIEVARHRLRATSVPQRPGPVIEALGDLRLGVVIFDADHNEVYRNKAALEFASGRHGDALIEAALERTIDGAFVGLALEEAVDLYGPPPRNLTVQAQPLSDEATSVGVVAVIEDVTEARHLDRVRSDFVANVSHELRTPVGGMSVLSEALSGSTDPKTQRHLAQRIERECMRLSETLDDLLVLSRLESGTDWEVETVDVSSVVNLAIDRTASAAALHETVILFSNPDPGPILVEGNRSQLTSAVANLLDNAIKYSDAGQPISVALELGTTGGNADHVEEVRLSITDTGIGIPESDGTRIFERFYRVDSARSRKTGGTGLGLSIVRHVALNHGGTVEVDSTEGVGSTFTIRLPQSPVPSLDRPSGLSSDP